MLEAGHLLQRHPPRLEPRRDVRLHPLQQLLGDVGRLGQVLHRQRPVGQHVRPGQRLPGLQPPVDRDLLAWHHGDL